MSAYHKILQAVFAKLGYTLDENIADIILHPAQHKLIKAPAGGTKTTLSQMISNKEKLEFLRQKRLNKNTSQFLDTSDILCLVYNSHNVPDVLNVHKRIYNAFESFGLFSQSLTSENYMVQGLKVSTVHTHSKEFIKKHKHLIKFREVKLCNQGFVDALLAKSFESVMGGTEQFTPRIKELYQLYTNLLLYREDTYLDVFLFNAELSPDIYSKYKEAFKSYDLTKQVTKNTEFSDWIKYAIDIHEKFPDAVLQDKLKYKFILADEVQDFTPLMLEYLKNLVHDKAKTIIIGDSDQTVYQFNGASHKTLDSIPHRTGLDFTRFFMNTNRRCSERTMSYARVLLNKMTDREDFEIKTVKPGGEFKTLYYETISQELTDVMNDFDKNYHSTNAFLFRTRDMSIPLTRMFYEQNRPYSLFNATSFHMHPFYKGFLETVKTVFVFQDRSVWKHLHKILPINKKKLEELLQFDADGNPKAFPEILRWSKLDLLQTRKTFSTVDAWFWQIMFAIGLAENYDNIAARDVVEILLEMYSKNFYNYLNNDETYLEYIKDILRDDFNTNNNLKWVVSSIENKIAKTVTNKQLSSINVCTIHATKGLEFDRVYLMSMHADERQFDTQVELRLYYVGATRQRKALILSIDNTNPHPLATPEYVVAQTVTLENRFDINPVTSFDSLFDNNDNPNIRRVPQ